MYINDKYVVDVIMSVIMNSDVVIETPKDYEYEYEDMHGIRLSDLREILNDILKKRGVNMKTLHDYLNIICGGYKSPLYTMLTKFHDPARLTVCGRMLCISIDMLYGGEY